MAKQTVEKNLVIVESPMKARTIKKFLPKNFVVKASMGHVRDLPQSAADIPAKLKKEPWARLGVQVENGFEPLYTVSKGKSKVITELRKELKDATCLYLATDEDREGESISWHLVELLKPKIPVKRMVFHEITKNAIQKALEDTREIDGRLVASQEARRILDRLVGYTLSPLIWKKIAYGLSAGRVQSAGLRLIVERERERMDFKKAVYWDIKAALEKDKQDFEARLTQVRGKRVASGKDFDNHGKLKKAGDILVLDEKEVKAIADAAKKDDWIVSQVEEKEMTSNPQPPFITSSLQQEANRKLRMSARQAMMTAQSLYEKGLITYMRTDSPHLSSQAINGARSAVEDLYGKEYLSDKVRQFTSKSSSAQEAHEAIRPAGEAFTHPKDTSLSKEELRLYELIWKRTLACQMAPAKKMSMQVKITAGDATFSTSGMKIVFPGFLRAYVEGTDDPESALEDREVILPNLKKGEKVKLKELENLKHETKPVPRYTEASLIRTLENLGLGRPSTYASIIGTIIERSYVRREGNALVPSFTGFAVTQLLEKHFSNLVDYGFTSEMEKTLDEIAEGKRESRPYLKDFYLGRGGLLKQVEKKEDEIDAAESRAVDVVDMKDVEVRVGRFGPYVVKKTEKGKEDVRASIPEELAPADLTEDMLQEIISVSEKGPQPIGKHPETGENIYVLLGRYGPYVQQGEVTKEAPKPRRASVPKEIDSRNITLDEALKLLSLPREVGIHPETKTPIIANRGRFGPYLAHGDDFRSLKKEDDVFTVGLKRALEIYAQEKRTRRGSKALKDFGKHPKTDKKLGLYEGKYGPYIKHGTKNISLPADMDPEKLTAEQAAKVVDESKKK